MAHYKNGKIKGLIGDLVGYERNGENYLRKAPNRTAPATEGELKNRFMLELLSQWLKPITPFLRKGFRSYSWNFEGFSAAFSVNYKNALQKNGYDSYIDPSLVKVSHGELGLSNDLQVLLSPQKVLEFSWSPAINQSQGPRDRIMLLAYNPDQKQAFHELNGPIRYQGSASLSLTSALPGTWHLYAAFVAEDGSRQSESEYLGSLSIEY